MNTISTASLHNVFRQIRRQSMQAGIHGALWTSRFLPTSANVTRCMLATLTRSVIPLRARLHRNLVLGLGSEHVPRGTVDRYFDRFGAWAAWAIAAYNTGFWKSAVPNHISFDETWSNLEDAVGQGRGVVLAAAHFFCEELGAAMINHRDNVALLVRESKTRHRQILKDRWYQALGLQTVARPRKSNAAADMMAALRVLRNGKILGITPDVLVAPESGLNVSMFGRDVALSPGAVLLAMRARCPLVSVVPSWPAADQLVIGFTKPVQFALDGDRRQTLRTGFEHWCRQLEQHLCQHPEQWKFWLDKRWTKVLRTQKRKEPDA